VEKFEGEHVGSFGELSETVSFDELCRYIKTSFDLSSIDVVGDMSAIIKKVGICCGAGFSVEQLEEAFQQGCDVFISGDVKHHEAQYAHERGICLIDAGHYGTEKFFSQNFSQKLKNELDREIVNDVEIIVSELDLDPFVQIPH
jgi:putative NIF3 family GTP cyclohydrolase 1 type 2